MYNNIMMNKTVDGFTSKDTQEEYENMFPYEQEYMLWIEAIEADFIREAKIREQEKEQA